MPQQNLHATLKDRVEEYNLSPEEVAAIDRARGQLSSHTTFGGFIGAATGAFLGVRRRFSPWASFALAGGGFLIGSQMGLVSGALAGVRTIKTLPNSERLINLVRDVQNEILAERGFKRDSPTSPPRRMTPAERDSERRQQPSSGRRQDENGEFIAEDDSLIDNAAIEKPFEDPDAPRRRVTGYPSQQQQQRQVSEYGQDQEEERSESDATRRGTWDKIRSENLPNERPTWAKLREQAQKEKQSQSNGNGGQSDDTMSSSQAQIDNLPRTREEMEQANQRTRRNKYGDTVE